MKKIICLMGLPASGKSTWAKKMVEEEGYVRFNKDDIRIELHDGVFSKENEIEVVKTERDRVESAMEEGLNIIVDNTHLPTKKRKTNHHLEFYSDLADEHGYEFSVKEFYITRDEAVERDKNREDSVGEEVIDRMIKISIIPKEYPANPVFKEVDLSLPPCIICDIDGTIAFMNHQRSPYDYTRVWKDNVNPFLGSMLDTLEGQGYEIIYLSGRNEDCREETQQWLDYRDIGHRKLIMRAEGDARCDSIVKEELYREHIEGKYLVHAVFDDRDRVVNKWRELGLPTYQVWYGDF